MPEPCPVPGHHAYAEGDCPRCTRICLAHDVTKPCGACRADRLAREAATDTTPVLTLSPEQAAVNARGVRVVRAALANHREDS